MQLGRIYCGVARGHIDLTAPARQPACGVVVKVRGYLDQRSDLGAVLMYLVEVDSSLVRIADVPVSLSAGK
jgi:hypothetical protein